MCIMCVCVCDVYVRMNVMCMCVCIYVRVYVCLCCVCMCVRLGSTLEYRLHRLRYLSILTSGDKGQALAYARAHFDRFARRELAGVYE